MKEKVSEKYLPESYQGDLLGWANALDAEALVMLLPSVPNPNKALVLKGQEKEDDKEDLEEQVYEPNIDEN
nr:hypothetical protein CFP56_12464 [Quercus suber]